MDSFDSDGYKMVSEKFKSGEYTYTFVKNLDDNWKIYSVYSPSSNRIIDYELVKFIKSEEYILHGVKVQKKLNYPKANAFGKNGFSCRSIAGCEFKLKQILKNKKEAESFDKNFQIPKGKKFSIKDLSDEYGVPYSKIYSAVKLLGDKVKKVSEIKNKKGKPTTIYLLE